LVVTPPEGLGEDHPLDAFNSRHGSLNAWLMEKAIHNQLEGASKTYVVCDGAAAGRRVVGYYALAAGSVTHDQIPGRLRRNVPNPIPVVVLGRLAVDQAYEGQGIGSGLLKDAVARTLRTAQEIGIRAILCHAIDEAAKSFYLHHGFIQSPIEDLTVLLPLGGLARRLEQAQSR
jgi:GNAT superfamily N-acetyltransferase